MANALEAHGVPEAMEAVSQALAEARLNRAVPGAIRDHDMALVEQALATFYGRLTRAYLEIAEQWASRDELYQAQRMVEQAKDCVKAVDVATSEYRRLMRKSGSKPTPEAAH